VRNDGVDMADLVDGGGDACVAVPACNDRRGRKRARICNCVVVFLSLRATAATVVAMVNSGWRFVGIFMAGGAGNVKRLGAMFAMTSDYMVVGNLL